MQAWHSDIRRLVQATMDALPERYGDVLEWKYVDGLPVADIAARLDIGAKAAESLLTRARAAFREAILAMADVPDALHARRQDWSLVAHERSSRQHRQMHWRTSSEAAGRREAPPAQAYERALAAATQVWQAKVRRRRWRHGGEPRRGHCGAGHRRDASPCSHSTPSDAIDRSRSPRRTGDRRSAGSVRRFARLDFAARRSAETLPSGAHTSHRSRQRRSAAASTTSLSASPRTPKSCSNRARDCGSTHGKVYVDTGSDGVAGRMLVVTDAGSVSDVGTQFEVQYRQGDYRVRVREGEVLLQNAAQLRARRRAGEQISIDASGTVSVTAIRCR